MGQVKILLGLAFCLALPVLPVREIMRNGVHNSVEMPTSDRLLGQGWWPTKGTPAREQYVGSAACGSCHKEKSGSQKTTPMAHAAMPAAASGFLAGEPALTLPLDPYNYKITQSDGKFFYSVRSGAGSASASLLWAFGSGEAGQTYVYEKNGTFYESRLSYYTKPHALDLTAGHPHTTPENLDAALGRPMAPGEARLCFGCHTTASTTHNRFDATRVIPGVSCEACHGPGDQHVAAMNLDPDGRGAKFITNPAALAPVDSVEFCGACHRTRWDVELSRAKGLEDVRFQGYRLETSKCFGNGDTRITCVACHDPHVPLVREAASYDKNCLACHAVKTATQKTAKQTAPACPVKNNDCVSCHMPKLDVSVMHSMFTDHRIRIVRIGEAFPE